MSKAFKRLDGVTDVEFDEDNTAFVISSEIPVEDYESKFTDILEHWEHYEYRVGKMEIVN